METVTILLFMVLLIYSIVVYFINPVIRLVIRYLRSSDTSCCESCYKCGFVYSSEDVRRVSICPSCGLYPDTDY